MSGCLRLPKKRAALFFAGLIFSAVTLFGADGVPPANYKARIEEFLGAKNPTYRIYCDYYEPKRILVGDAKKSMCAVRCDWDAKLRSGAMALLTVPRIFLFDGDKLVEADRGEKIEWVDGKPALDRTTRTRK